MSLRASKKAIDLAHDAVAAEHKPAHNMLHAHTTCERLCRVDRDVKALIMVRIAEYDGGVHMCNLRQFGLL